MNDPVRIAPRWRIVSADDADPGDAWTLKLAPGSGFGDGKHPTTQVCLQALAALAPRERPWRLLDFGSGSAILSVAAVRLGAKVDAVEIDTDAIEHAARNLSVNGVEDRVRQTTSLSGTDGSYDFIVANILRSVLDSFAAELVARLAPRGTLVLSGLVSTDVPAIIARYTPLLGGARPEIYDRDEWRAVVWRAREA